MSAREMFMFGYQPDYNKKEKYAVLYMQDGDENLFGTDDKETEWGVDETITKLIKEKKIRKTIVVAIEGFTGIRPSFGILSAKISRKPSD